MEYTKIQNDDYNNNGDYSNKKITLIDKENDTLDIEEKIKDIKILNNKITNGNILIIMLLIIFIFLIFIYQNITSNITKLTNTNTLNKEKEEIDTLNEEELIPEKIPYLQDIYKIEKFNSREKAFKKAKKFLENCINGTLLREIPKTPIENPIASGIIPVYNSKNYISKAIKSIQNQNILNIEIILVDDFSNDDTLSFIKEIQKKDSRIKIISNKKNMGILYSRCIGALSAKGKYIFPLDNDDMFLDEDVFITITNIAEKGFFDIVEFKGIESKQVNKDILNNKRTDIKFANHPLNLVLYQPALGNYQFWRGKTLSSFHIEIVYLWAKCIRTKIYQKAINKLGKEKYSIHIVRYEDIFMNYALCNIARSYKFVGKYGVFNINREKSASKIFTKAENARDHIYFFDIILDFVQDRVENKMVLVNLIMNIFNRKSLKKALTMNKDIKKLFISGVNKVLNMTKISDELKNEIRKKGNTLKFLNYTF